MPIYSKQQIIQDALKNASNDQERFSILRHVIKIGFATVQQLRKWNDDYKILCRLDEVTK